MRPQQFYIFTAIFKQALLTICLIANINQPLWAHDETEDTNSFGTKFDTELGHILTKGNTNTQTINGGINWILDGSNWQHELTLQGLSISENQSTSAEKYLGNSQLNYKFKQRDYVFTSILYEDDRFSGYQYQLTWAIGYGSNLIQNNTHLLALEIGPGYRRNKFDDSSIEEERIIQTKAKYQRPLSRTAEIKQELTVDYGNISTISKSETAIKTQIDEKLAMKVTYTIRHASVPPSSNSSTDKETAITLVYSF